MLLRVFVRLNSFITRRALEPFRPCFIAKVSRQVNGRVSLFNSSLWKGL